MKNSPNYLNKTYQKAFTLVEMAIVLVIVGLVIGGLLSSLTAQVEQQKLNETRVTINNIKESLLGYAMANGRFPCPATAPNPPINNVTAVEVGNSATGVCTIYDGWVPSVTLGLSPTDTEGYVLDGWNNPIRYAIANLSDDADATHIFTKSSGMKTANSTTCSPNCGMAWIATQTLLSVCSTGTGIVGSLCSSAITTLNQNSVIVVYSTGKNTVTGGTGTDEAANLNADQVFVSHPPFAVGATNGEFDDIVEWISPNSIFSRLVQANQLP
ncbi:MAG: type II secretion system protein [Methylotenera sp.]|nr:type II secretion system protein [Methylotenera sp.]